MGKQPLDDYRAADQKGDVAIHRLLAFDAPGLVLLAPQRADHAGQILPIPEQMGQGADIAKPVEVVGSPTELPQL